MPFYINEELYFEDITLTQEEFYQKLDEDADIKTSQPAPGDVLDLWEKLLEDHDEIVHIAMSSGLSSSCATAAMLADDYDGKVQVVAGLYMMYDLAKKIGGDQVEVKNLVPAGTEPHEWEPGAIEVAILVD